MLHVRVGKISQLSAPQTVARWLSASLAASAPDGARRHSWLAGRVMLAAHCPEESLQALTYNHHGKPAFRRPGAPHFNISHSGDEIVLAVDKLSAVGVDMEIIRPRHAWRRIAKAYFGDAPLRHLQALPETEQLAAFWRNWTLREAVLKQRGDSVWNMAALDVSPAALAASHRYIGWHNTPTRLIAVCAAHPFECQVTTMHGV